MPAASARFPAPPRAVLDDVRPFDERVTRNQDHKLDACIIKWSYKQYGPHHFALIPDILNQRTLCVQPYKFYL